MLRLSLDAKATIKIGPFSIGTEVFKGDISTVINFAQTMKWKGSNPKVKLVTETYQTGVKLTKPEMEKIENQIQRLPELGKWFVDIFYDSA
jgi:hypothetical protein